MQRVLSLAAMVALVVAVAMPIGIDVASAQAKNPCNPCAAKAKNPCNPCAVKASNPCTAKAKNPCNPCGAKKTQ